MAEPQLIEEALERTALKPLNSPVLSEQRKLKQYWAAVGRYGQRTK